jgi:hypothetical protein
MSAFHPVLLEVEVEPATEVPSVGLNPQEQHVRHRGLRVKS